MRFNNDFRLDAHDLSQFAALKRAADRYTRYNFHASTVLESLMRWNTSDRNTPLLLKGAPGIGKGYLLNALASIAPKSGRKHIVLHIDFDGYEPDQPLANFLQYQQINDNHSAKLRVAVSDAGAPSIWDALLVLLITGAEEVRRAYEKLIENEQEWAGLPARKRCMYLLKAASNECSLIIHLQEGFSIPVMLLGGLLEEIRNFASSVRLAISCEPGILAQQKQPVLDCTTIAVQELTEETLKSTLDRNFSPNQFPDIFYEHVLAAIGGVPWQVAMYMFELVNEGVIKVDSSGYWYIAEPNKIFYSALPLSRREHSDLYCAGNVSKPVENALKNFMSLAASCGSIVPGAMLIQHLGLDVDTANALIEIIDTALVGNDSVFLDLQYQHPGFARQFTYKFSSIAALRAIESGPGTMQNAYGFFRFLKNHAPKTCAIFRMMHHLAKLNGQQDEAEMARTVLLFWSSEQDMLDLSCMDISLLRQHFLPEQIVDALTNMWEALSASQQERMLDLCFHFYAELSQHAQGRIHYWRALQFRRRWDFEASSCEAQKAVDRLSAGMRRDIPLLAMSQALKGLNSLSKHDYDQTCNSLKQALAQLGAAANLEHFQILILHEFASHAGAQQAGTCLRNLILEQALSITGSIKRKECSSRQIRSYLSLFRCLSDCFRQAGAEEESFLCLETALEHATDLHGGESDDAATLLKLMADAVQESHPATAYSCLKKALEIEAHRNNNPQELSIMHKRLADLTENLGDLSAARVHLQLALISDETLYGKFSSNLAILCKLLANISSRMGDQQLAEHYSERASTLAVG